MFKKVKVTAAILALVMAFASCAPAAGPGQGAEGGTTQPPAGADPAPPPAPGDPAAPAAVTPAPAGTTGLGAELRQHIDETHALWQIVELSERFPTRIDRDAPAMQGGHLVVGVPSDTPVPGTFNVIDQTTALDGNFMDWFTGGNVFSFTPARTFGHDGIVTWEYDIDEMSFTMHMRDGIYPMWHDGVPMTLDDIVFAHEMIASPGYGGIRYTVAQRRVVGAEEFHRGEADHISGLVLSNNNRTLKIYFTDFPPSILHNGFWAVPHPRHVFENIPVDEAPNHAMTRSTPIGFGPFIVENIVPGESMLLRANEDYWQGRPLLDYVTIQVVPTDLVPALMLSGEIDIAWTFRVEDFPEYEHQATNFSFLGDVQNNFGIISFNLGDWDPSISEVVPHENPKFADVRLRRAMGFAINERELTDYFFHGLRLPATSIIPPGHSRFLDFDLEGFTYDPDRARAYLDAAGFTEFDDEGFRLDPDGNHFEVVFATRIRADWDFMTPWYIQQWANVGIRVVMYQGRQHDFTAMSENIWSSDNWPEVDMFEAAWVAGFDPNPNGLWGHTVNNRPRYMNDELYGILNRFNSMQAWDTDYLIRAYRDWQQAFYRTATVIPTNWMMGLFAANNRVTGWELSSVLPTELTGGFHRIGVTTDVPYRR